VAARCSEFNCAGTPNRAAREFIKPSLLNNPAVYPPPEVIERLEYARDLGEKNRLYEELWTQIKAR
jgi:spermidine/putrescine transport system substrate-binding protein